MATEGSAVEPPHSCGEGALQRSGKDQPSTRLFLFTSEGWKVVRLGFGHRKGRQFPGGLLVNAGNHLRSHTLTRAVPSAQRGLTSVFGMGTGVTLAVYSPANRGVLQELCFLLRVLSTTLTEL